MLAKIEQHLPPHFQKNMTLLTDPQKMESVFLLFVSKLYREYV